MAQFLGDIAYTLEILTIATGLVLIDKAASKPPAKLLRAAGIVLFIGGLIGILCTTWYWLTYQAAGEFDHATSGPVETEPSPYITQEMD